VLLVPDQDCPARASQGGRMTWATSRDAVPAYVTQITVYDEATGERIATVFNAEAVPLIAAAPDLLELAILLESAFTQWASDDSDEFTFGEWVEKVGLDELTVRGTLAKAKGNT
jgi:hypothetical protein